LLDGKTWLKSLEISGPWTVTTKLPAEMAKLPANQWAEVLKAVPPPAGAQTEPKVFVTEKPAELIIFNGQPIYSAIPGTSLSYATNTDSNVFLHAPEKQLYVLLSGRWFRAGGLNAPWVYAGNDLPPDFARIPPGHSYSTVLVSVPGTQVASDAVLLSQVPTTAIVNRSAAESSVKVVYEGAPQFVPVESTTLFYAVNTPYRVIRVGDLYYLCYQGIWFIAKNPTGPWKTADSVPAVIYMIPPTSPVYNVTYVIVSNPTPTTVESSYSSGYLGVFVLGMAVGATAALDGTIRRTFITARDIPFSILIHIPTEWRRFITLTPAPTPWAAPSTDHTVPQAPPLGTTPSPECMATQSPRKMRTEATPTRKPTIRGPARMPPLRKDTMRTASGATRS
jgi:hypothetical protein